MSANALVRRDYIARPLVVSPEAQSFQREL